MVFNAENHSANKYQYFFISKTYQLLQNVSHSNKLIAVSKQANR